MSQLNLVSLLGIFVMLAMAWSVSSHRTKVNWGLVVAGIVLQAVLAAVLFQSRSWTFDGQFENGILFAAVDGFFKSILAWVEKGSGFMFGINGLAADDPTNPQAMLKTFAFGVLPTVIFFAALMSVLYHIGLMQLLIRGMAWVMKKTLGISGPESLAMAANVLVGHTEAPLVIKPYVAGMTRSELNALMVGGFATISGSLMAIFVNLGVSAGHILSASIISAPAAIVIAKILQPEIETPADVRQSDAASEKVATNVIEAAAIGASDGMKLAINIAAMLIAFLAIIAMIDALLGGIGELIQYLVNVAGLGESILAATSPVGLDGFFNFVFSETGRLDVDLQWSLSGLFGQVFYPLAWVMGIEARDCLLAGDLLGKKMVINEFVAYYEMSGAVIRPDDASFVAGSLSERSKVILTYALCGFSNFGAIGIQIGGIGPLAPERRGDLAQLGMRAMFGGMLACCMTACMAGVMYGLLN